MEDKKKKEGRPWELEISGEHRLRQENLAFDIDVWYPMLREVTFPTEFLPLTRTEAFACLRYYSQRFLGRPFRGRRLTTEDVSALRELESMIDRILAKGTFGGKGDGNGNGGAFLRLCGRSPKDGEPLNRDAVKSAYSVELDRLRGLGYDANEPNTQLMAVAGVHWLRVANGSEAMSLLLTSERVYADLRDWADFGEPEQIVLRRWEPRLTYDREFRLFVSRGSVTAVTQYDHFAWYPWLAAEREAILARLLGFWESSVRQRMAGIPNYVVDLGDLVDGGVVLIEISPFLECTGTALFNWQRDRGVLENGPLEFRLRCEPFPEVESLVEAGWKMRWATDVPPYSNWYAEAVDPSDEPAGAAAAGEGSAVRTWSSLAWSAWSWLTSLLAGGSIGGKADLLFVYGTLKRGFHWSSKFLGRSEFVCEARTAEPMALVVGDCGVPYMLGDLSPPEMTAGGAKCILGEVWRVNAETLEGLDEYEGVTKGHYRRDTIAVGTSDGRLVHAFCYQANKSTPELRAKPFIDEYTFAVHRSDYNPILHILVKQQLYLHRPLLPVSSPSS